MTSVPRRHHHRAHSRPTSAPRRESASPQDFVKEPPSHAPPAAPLDNVLEKWPEHKSEDRRLSAGSSSSETAIDPASPKAGKEGLTLPKSEGSQKHPSVLMTTSKTPESGATAADSVGSGTAGGGGAGIVLGKALQSNGLGGARSGLVDEQDNSKVDAERDQSQDDQSNRDGQQNGAQKENDTQQTKSSEEEVRSADHGVDESQVDADDDDAASAAQSGNTQWDEARRAAYDDIKFRNGQRRRRFGQYVEERRRRHHDKRAHDFGHPAGQADRTSSGESQPIWVE